MLVSYFLCLLNLSFYNFIKLWILAWRFKQFSYAQNGKKTIYFASYAGTAEIDKNPLVIYILSIFTETKKIWFSLLIARIYFHIFLFICNAFFRYGERFIAIHIYEFWNFAWTFCIRTSAFISQQSRLDDFQRGLWQVHIIKSFALLQLYFVTCALGKIFLQIFLVE